MTKRNDGNVRNDVPEVIVLTEDQRVKPQSGLGKRSRDPEDGDFETWSVEEDDAWLRKVGALK